jgi:hypothetical protein
MDAKAQRAFVDKVVGHLQKTLRSHDVKDTEGLLKSLDDAASMIKFVTGGKNKRQQKRGRKKKVAPADAPAAETPAVAST